jgi:peptidoglycan/xylan/chitin deacetylase (PgdA/CDA1 family)
MFPLEPCAERFDWQMAMLRRFCTPIDLRAGVQGLRQGVLPARAVAVTFDDGYADNADVALPILRRHAVPATFFVSTAFLDGGRMWNDTVIESVRRASGAQLDLRDLGLAVEPLGDALERGLLSQKILRAVKYLHPAERSAKVDALQRQIGASLPNDLMMAAGQVRGLADAGMNVGAHTVNHPILRTLRLDEATEEICNSRDRLEGIIGRRVTSFAYPNGRPEADYTLRDRDLVQSLGFDHAVSTTLGVAAPQSDLFQLPRFGAWDRKPERWLARLLLAFRRVH